MGNGKWAYLRKQQEAARHPMALPKKQHTPVASCQLPLPFYDLWAIGVFLVLSFKTAAGLRTQNCKLNELFG
jgi:hypothetical protein